MRLYQNPSKVNTFALIIHVLTKALKKFFQILSTHTQLEFQGKFQPQNLKKKFCIGSKTCPPYTSFGTGAPPFLVQAIPKLVQGGHVLVRPIPVLEIHLLFFFQKQVGSKKKICIGSKTFPPYTSFGIGAPPFLVQVIPKLVQGGQVLVCPIPVLEIHLLLYIC